MALGRPVKPIDSDKNAAPIRIKAIMADVLVAPIRLTENVDQLRDPWAADSIKAPTTPTAAASVAVANPKYIDPMTTQTNPITGTRNRLSFIILENGIEGSFCGRSPVPKKCQTTM